MRPFCRRSIGGRTLWLALALAGACLLGTWGCSEGRGRLPSDLRGRLDLRTAEALEQAGGRPLGLLGVGEDPARLAFLARSAGLLPGPPAGGVVPLRGPSKAYRWLLRSSREVELWGPGRLRPLLDVSGPLIGARAAETGEGLPRSYDGSGVVVGVIDLGVDLTHPDFRHDDGSTRIVALWDQLGTPHPPLLPAPAPYGYGYECTPEVIQEGDCPEVDDGESLAGFAGHGTHVSGIAAGSGKTIRGIAPKALIVFVKSNLDEAGVLQAVQYVFGLAGRWGMPAVVNISLGEHEGGHDGRTPFEEGLSSLVGPGRIIVAAVGNEGWPPSDPQCCIHAGATVPAGASAAVAFESDTPGSPLSPAQIETWCTDNGGEGLWVGAEAPSGSSFLATTPVVPAGEWVTTTLAGPLGTLGEATLDARPVMGGAPGDQRLLVELTQGQDPSVDLRTTRWVIGWRNAGPTPIRCDAWGTGGRFGLAPGPTLGVFFVPGDNRETVGEPATARGVIAAGAFVSRLSWVDVEGTTVTLTSPSAQVGGLAPFSSRGPTRRPDLTGDKPEITAPGMVILSARPLYLFFPPDELSADGLHFRELGSSMSAPHVAGAAALLLDRNPSLTPDAIVAALRSGAVVDGWTGPVPNPDWGGGKLDVLDALRAVPPGIVRTTPPLLTGLSVEREAGGRTALHWNTDEPASSEVDLTGCGGARTVRVEAYATDHVVALSGLGPFERCTAVARSIDPRGNAAASPEVIVQGTSAAGGCSTTPGTPPWLLVEGVGALALRRRIRKAARGRRRAGLPSKGGLRNAHEA